MNYESEVKAAVGRYLGRFFERLVPDTKGLEEYKQRPLSKSILFAPARLIDAAEELLSRYQRENGSHNLLPIMIVAVDRSFTPTGRADASFQVSDSPLTVMANDPKQRAFKIRTIGSNYRVQIAIFSHDVAAAKSIAQQLMLFVDALENRRAYVDHTFSGITESWAAHVSMPDNPVMNIQSQLKNLTILSVDMNVKATLPMYEAPKVGEPNDGKGDPSNPDDLAGYLLYESEEHVENFIGGGTLKTLVATDTGTTSIASEKAYPNNGESAGCANKVYEGVK